MQHTSVIHLSYHIIWSFDSVDLYLTCSVWRETKYLSLCLVSCYTIIFALVVVICELAHCNSHFARIIFTFTYIIHISICRYEIWLHTSHFELVYYYYYYLFISCYWFASTLHSVQAVSMLHISISDFIYIYSCLSLWSYYINHFTFIFTHT